MATCYGASPLNSPDGFGAGECPAVRPGAAALDAPLDNGWLLDQVGDGFSALWFSRNGGLVPDALAQAQTNLAQRGRPVRLAIVSRETACARYGAEHEPALYLFRPDQHVAGRWRGYVPGAIEAALDRAMGKP